MPESRSSIDLESLQQSLLIETVKLFALAARADEVITDSESAYVREYFSRSYPPEFTDFLHGEFLRFTQEDLSVESVTAASRSRLKYEEKVFLMGKLLELLAADEVTREEQAFWAELGDRLGLTWGDLQVLEALWLDQPIPDEHSHSLRWLWITDREGGGDLTLDTPGLRLLVLRIRRRILLKQVAGPQGIWLDEQGLLPHLLWRLPPDVNIRIDEVSVTPLDLKFLFRNQSERARDHWFQVSDQEFSILPGPTEAHLHLRVAKGKATLRRQEGFDQPIWVAGQLMQDQQELSLLDKVRVGQARLSLRRFLLEGNRAGKGPSLPGKHVFSIGNQYESDLLIEDDLEESWECLIEAGEWHFKLDPSGCPYPVWVNGKRIRRSHSLDPLDRIRIRQVDISWHEEEHRFLSQETSFTHLEVRDLSYAFPDGTVGLDEVSFSARRRQLVGILGPSGSGKSTLLNLINGLHAPQPGQIWLDKWDLAEHFDQFKDRMGFVPQDDLLFENLTVYENLYFNACLRYPDSVNKLQALVNGVLRDIGLYEKKDLRVGSPEHKILSGGQRKRLNIGLELLADNELMMFDEPTSGLSSKDSERILRLIKQLAQRGKLILVVIHQPSRRLYQLFDRIMLLDRGGRLVFYGKNQEALRYFQPFSPGGESLDEDSEDQLEPELLLD
ncbi:MAG: ATP-binding cassette domain-containing protein, partial [Bacteroidota bacterium]